MALHEKRQQTITYAGYTDDMPFLANTPTQVESLLHGLEQAAGGIDPYVNADKTEYTCFDQAGDSKRWFSEITD